MRRAIAPATSGSNSVGATLGLGIGGSATGSNGNGANITPGAVAREFSRMDPSDQKKMLVRCRDVAAGGYDSGLAGLCKMLRTLASR